MVRTTLRLFDNLSSLNSPFSETLAIGLPASHVTAGHAADSLHN